MLDIMIHPHVQVGLLGGLIGGLFSFKTSRDALGLWGACVNIAVSVVCGGAVAENWGSPSSPFSVMLVSMASGAIGGYTLYNVYKMIPNLVAGELRAWLRKFLGIQDTGGKNESD